MAGEDKPRLQHVHGYHWVAVSASDRDHACEGCKLDTVLGRVSRQRELSWKVSGIARSALPGTARGGSGGLRRPRARSGPGSRAEGKTLDGPCLFRSATLGPGPRRLPLHPDGHVTRVAPVTILRANARKSAASAVLLRWQWPDSRAATMAHTRADMTRSPGHRCRGRPGQVSSRRWATIQISAEVAP